MIELNQLASLWNGHYVQLWKPPEKDKFNAYQGDRGEFVVRLRELLAEFDASSQVTQLPTVFDKKLAEIVLRFQVVNGLDADGIVGPKTWILVNNLANAERPRLRLKGG
jgi:general secretion pathway protein A